VVLSVAQLDSKTSSSGYPRTFSDLRGKNLRDLLLCWQRNNHCSHLKTRAELRPPNESSWSWPRSVKKFNWPRRPPADRRSF